MDIYIEEECTIEFLHSMREYLDNFLLNNEEGNNTGTHFLAFLQQNFHNNLITKDVLNHMEVFYLNEFKLVNLLNNKIEDIFHSTIQI